MSNVSLGPTPIPELTHIMVGLESCSFLVSPSIGRVHQEGQGTVADCCPSAFHRRRTSSPLLC